MRLNKQSLPILALLLISLNVWAVPGTSSDIFGYQQIVRSNLEIFPQWLSVLERHIEELTPAGKCQQTRFNQCHLKQWLRFLASIKNLPEHEQIRRVNQYANEKEYVLDIENYGMDDYWATPKQFLTRNGDCEDFAIIKMLSLKRLGIDTDRMRVVVVQDTNLRIAHAVMALDVKRDMLILDNQVEEVISHKDIFHYVPVYSVSENKWWMHLPK